MNNFWTKISIELGIITVNLLYNALCYESYKGYSAYWIIDGVLRLAFWSVAFYPNYRWRQLDFFKRLIVVAVSIDFCISFLPADILLLPVTDNIRSYINLIVLVGMIFQDRGGGGGKRKRHEDSEEGKKRKEKLRLATDNA